MRRLRINVTDVSPGYITVSLFQSDNGVNWACVGTGITFGDEWFLKAFTEGMKVEAGVRLEFEVGRVYLVEDGD